MCRNSTVPLPGAPLLPSSRYVSLLVAVFKTRETGSLKGTLLPVPGGLVPSQACHDGLCRGRPGQRGGGGVEGAAEGAGSLHSCPART